jgi:hypothetical protein
MICNGYPYLIRNLLHKILCITQPVVHSTHENKSQSPPEVTQNSNLVPVTYSPMEVEGSQSLLPTLYKQWLEAGISNRQDNRDGSELLLLPRILQESEETREIPEHVMGSAQC